MTYKDKLYDLLPEYYRIQDVKEGRALESLLKIIGEQADILEENISELYENWFIETCKEWMIPYIGDLVATRNLNHEVIKDSSSRSWVCNTIGFRRRKGTLAMLENLSHDVTGWHTKTIEFFRLLSCTQNVNNFRKITTVNMRDTGQLALRNTPFNTLSHNLDVRHINNNRGKYNISNIGFFLWRLQPYPVNNSQAYDFKDGKFTFSQLGYDIPLFNIPQTEQKFSDLADEINVPEPIPRLTIKNNLTKYYGDGKAIDIEADGSEIPVDQIVVANLTDWKNRPSGKVAVDPVLGRILFPINKTPKKVYVRYHSGFSSEIGFRFSEREVSNQGKTIPVYYIAKNDDTRKKLEISPNIFKTFNDAIAKWKTNGDLNAIFEIVDSEIYDEPIDDISIPQNTSLEIRSQEGQRPVLKLMKPLSLLGTDKNSYQGNSIIIDGLIIDRKDNTVSTLIDIKGELGSLAVKYCTLVPSQDSNMKSLEIREGNDLLTIYVDHSISGRIDTSKSKAQLKFSDSIVDGKEKMSQGFAISCHRTTIENCTIFGSVEASQIDLARNTIFNDDINIRFRQKGIMQFCYVSPSSDTPRQFKCQPRDDTFNKIRPIFTSEQFGYPSYAQLDLDTDKAILEGADDENEMGVFNHLGQSARMDNLKVCLDEYMLFGLEAGILPIT